METTKFDGIARSLGSSITRRSALRGIFAGAMAAVAGGAWRRQPAVHQQGPPAGRVLRLQLAVPDRQGLHL